MILLFQLFLCSAKWQWFDSKWPECLCYCTLWYPVNSINSCSRSHPAPIGHWNVVSQSFDFYALNMDRSLLAQLLSKALTLFWLIRHFLVHKHNKILTPDMLLWKQWLIESWSFQFPEFSSALNFPHYTRSVYKLVWHKLWVRYRKCSNHSNRYACIFWIGIYF